jgi:hypothetical protein
MAFLLSNGRKRKRRRKAARKVAVRKVRRRRRRNAPKMARKVRRRRRRRAAPKMVRRRRKARRMSAPRRARRRRGSRRSRSFTVRMNPRKHRRGRARRRNPGLVQAVLAPIKEHGVGFAVGAGLDQFLVTPALLMALPPSVVSPAKVVVGPLLAAAVKRFLPRFGKMADSVALAFMAFGIKETIQQFTVTTPAAVHGLGRVGMTGLGRVGSTKGSIGSVGGTNRMRGLGAMSGAGTTPYGSGSPMGAYDRSAGYDY